MVFDRLQAHSIAVTVIHMVLHVAEHWKKIVWNTKLTDRQNRLYAGLPLCYLYATNSDFLATWVIYHKGFMMIPKSDKKVYMI